MRLYLVRHGEADGNTDGRCLGWLDPPLTAAGSCQAEELAQRLAGEPLVAVYSSDLVRSRQTAEAIAARHGLPVHALPALRELNFGDWSGLTYAEIARQDPDRMQAWLADPVHVAPPRGETLQALRERVLAALGQVTAPAVAVGHGGPWRAVLALWSGREHWEITLPVAGVSIVEWDGSSGPRSLVRRGLRMDS